jgi:hypothetical protein
MQKVLEKHLEAFFTQTCRQQQLLTLRLTLRGGRGWPDRLVFAHGRVLIVELKTLTGQPSPLQLHVHRLLAKAGHTVFVLRTKEEIADALKVFAQSGLLPSESVL